VFGTNDIGMMARRAAASVFVAVAGLVVAASAASAAVTPPDAVVLVSGITTTTPFTTPTAQCSGTEPRGETWSLDATRFAAQGYRVYTAPVNYGAGAVQPDPPKFSNCPPQLPASMTINSRGDIYANAQALASFIAYLRTHGGVKTIRIVAHSYGGLWTRGAMRLASAVFPGITVQSITTLGTPHLGSFMADIAEGIDPSFCGQDTTCKVIADLVIAAKDATFEPALSQVTAVSVAQWNLGQGTSLNGIPVSAIAGDAVSLPGITNPYVSPNDVLVGLRSAQAAGLKSPGVIPQLSCFAPFADVHSTTFLPFFPHVRYALLTDPVIATDVEQTLAGTPAPNPCPSKAAAVTPTHDVTATLRTGSSSTLGTRIPRHAGADDAIVLRTGTTVTCGGRALPSVPLLYSKRLRIIPRPSCSGTIRVRHPSGGVLYVRGTADSVTLHRSQGRVVVRLHGTPRGAKVTLAIKHGVQFVATRLDGRRSFGATGSQRTITCRVTVTPGRGRPELAVITLHL
jgi:triacylglycerol lipase